MKNRILIQTVNESLSRIKDPAKRAFYAARWNAWIDADARCNVLAWKITVTSCLCMLSAAVALFLVAR